MVPRQRLWPLPSPSVPILSPRWGAKPNKWKKNRDVTNIICGAHSFDMVRSCSELLKYGVVWMIFTWFVGPTKSACRAKSRLQVTCGKEVRQRLVEGTVPASGRNLGKPQVLSQNILNAKPMLYQVGHGRDHSSFDDFKRQLWNKEFSNLCSVTPDFRFAQSNIWVEL